MYDEEQKGDNDNDQENKGAFIQWLESRMSKYPKCFVLFKEYVNDEYDDDEFDTEDVSKALSLPMGIG